MPPAPAPPVAAAVQTFQVSDAAGDRYRPEFGADGRFLGVGSLTRYTRFDTTGAGPPETLNPVGFGSVTHFLGGGRTTISRTEDGAALAVHDRETRTRHRLAGGFVTGAAFCPARGEVFLAVWVPELPVRPNQEVWVVPPGGGFARYRCNAERLAVSADGNTLAGLGREYPGQWFRIWDVSDGTIPKRARTRVGWQTSVNDFALTHDGGLLAVADGSALTLWETRRGKRVAHSGQHRRGVTAVACSPNRPLLASGDNAGNVFLWDTQLRVLRRYAFGLSAVTGICFDADGLRAAAADDSGRVVVWDIDE